MRSLTIAALTFLTATAAVAQTSTTPGTIAPGTTTRPPVSDRAPAAIARAAHSGENLVLSDEQAKNWVNKSVYSSDNKNLGTVAAFDRDPAGKVKEMHADIGGFLGIGETRVRLMPNQFQVDGDRIIVSMTSDQAKSLPKIAK